MSKEKAAPHQAYNFKKLYSKQYGDFVSFSKNNRYTPEQVFNLAVKYFEWAEGNAIKAAETSSFQGQTYQDVIHKPRVFTHSAMRLFCGWSKCAVDKWRKEPGFDEVIEFIDTVIYEQKFQLAANGVVSASFIAKDLGVEKPAQVSVTATAEGATAINNVTAEEVKEAVADILEKI